jgi:MFS transporter, OFA family, oxalate/formate antiporter
MSNILQNEAQPPATELLNRRWFQLTIGVIAMMAISSPQYVWTLFVKPLQTTMNSSLAAIQVTFSVLIGFPDRRGFATGMRILRMG